MGIAQPSERTELPEDIFQSFSDFGPFLWKEHSTVLLHVGGNPSRLQFLKDPSHKHIFLLRNPINSIRSLVTTVASQKVHPASADTPAPLAAIFTGIFLENFWDPTVDLTELFDYMAGFKESYKLYRYLTERVKLPEQNILYVEIEEVWANPEYAMRHIAQFLELPWTPAFLNWEGIAFNYIPSDLIDHWFRVVKGSKGFVNRTNEAAKGISSTSEFDALSREWVQVADKVIEMSTPYYKWMKEHVPRQQRLPSLSNPSTGM